MPTDKDICSRITDEALLREAVDRLLLYTAAWSERYPAQMAADIRLVIRSLDEAQKQVASHEIGIKASLTAAITAMQAAPCCEGGPHWGHAWSCPNSDGGTPQAAQPLDAVADIRVSGGACANCLTVHPVNTYCPTQPLRADEVERSMQAFADEAVQTFLEQDPGRDPGTPLEDLDEDSRELLRRCIRAALLASNGTEVERLREADLTLALDLACRTLGDQEPPDSRAVSNEFVAMFSILCDKTNDECRDIIRAAIAEHETRTALESPTEGGGE